MFNGASRNATLDTCVLFFFFYRKFNCVLPENVVDAHDALWLRVLGVVNDCGLSFNPHVASFLGEHSILTGGSLALCKY